MTRAFFFLLAAAICGAGAVASAHARADFNNTAPMAAEQWYLDQDQAWSYWPTKPALATVKVAVVDSGIDAGNPEFAGQIAAGRSFVAGSWRQDEEGHGTFVAGLIAARGVKMSGIAFNAKLLIAKVVRPDADGVDPYAEQKAIIWAANQGARVINLSLGGVRDPEDTRFDTYSPGEEKAIEYAYSKGALVVAASGNGPESPQTPWPFADWPAALPHVLGVSALAQNGSVPEFSNRDKVFVDVAAPGADIFSTIPRSLIDKTQPNCAGVAYSNCGPADFQKAIGTSFAAPQVSAAAALLFGADPKLTPDQVEWLIERSAKDMNSTDGCPTCAPGRDSLTGWGRLDVQAALTMLADKSSLPKPDWGEPNDDIVFAQPFGPPRTISASLDYWDDPVDVYSIKLQAGRHLYARLKSSERGAASLTLLKPGTPTVVGAARSDSDRAATSARAGGQDRLSYLVPATATYYLEVDFLPPARARLTYSLSVSTTSK